MNIFSILRANTVSLTSFLQMALKLKGSPTILIYLDGEKLSVQGVVVLPTTTEFPGGHISFIRGEIDIHYDNG